MVKERRAAFFPDGAGFRPVDVYDRAMLPLELELAGPAIIEEFDATCVLADYAPLSLRGLGTLLVCESGTSPSRLVDRIVARGLVERHAIGGR